MADLHFPDEPADAAHLRDELIFAGRKWDAQVGDHDCVATVPLVLSRSCWRELARLAETLCAEVLAAESATIAARHPAGLPRRLRAHRNDVPGPRVMRFDFHPTVGVPWQVSEVNSDILTGYADAGPCAALLAARHPGLAMAGDPARALADAFARRLPGGGCIALVHDTTDPDDRMTMEVIATAFAGVGLSTRLCAPGQLRWRADGRPEMRDGLGFAGILRFYPCPWIAALPARARHAWLACAVPCANPLRAARSQSKRAPLAWRELGIRMPTWDALVPETRCPSHSPADPQHWVLKPAWGWEGTGISLVAADAAAAAVAAHRRRVRRARWWPWRWALQRRFDSRPIPSPWGPQHVTIGVYTVDGRCAGAFARCAVDPLIDARARHAAVLIAPDPP